MTSLATPADAASPDHTGHTDRTDRRWRRIGRLVAEWVPSLHSWRGALVAPFSPDTWRSVAHVTLTALVGIGPLVGLLLGAFEVALRSDVYNALSGATFWMSATASLAVALTALLLATPPLAGVLRWFTTQRDLRDLSRPRLARLDRTSPRAFLRSLYASPQRWRMLGKILVCGSVALAGLAAFAFVGQAAVRYLATPWEWRGLTLAYRHVPAQPVITLPGASNLVFAILIGVLLVYLTCLVAQAAGTLSGRVNRILLAPAADEVLTERVEQLTRTRSDVVDAADAERRRIERDLHDGAQQRLVALSVDLGLARRQAQADPAAALDALAHAQTEVEESLRELRDLVRGIYPQVLTDRGLHEAVEALVTRAPLPTSLESPGPKALAEAPAPLSAAAYFVVSECLSNAARHARARSAIVRIELAEGRLTVSVADDGAGGATFTDGRGLDGLRKRVTALDGSLILTSPAGDGTRVTAVFPCV